MKRRSLRFFALFAASLLTLLTSGCFLAPSAPSHPQFQVIDLFGRDRALDSYFGTRTVLFLWASWCPECVLELGNLNLLQKKLSGSGVRIIAVAVQDELSALNDLPPVKTATFPILLDLKNRLKDLYPVSELPTAYLLDGKGRPIPLMDPEDRIKKNKVVGFKEWQSTEGISAILASVGQP